MNDEYVMICFMFLIDQGDAFSKSSAHFLWKDIFYFFFFGSCKFQGQEKKSQICLWRI